MIEKVAGGGITHSQSFTNTKDKNELIPEKINQIPTIEHQKEQHQEPVTKEDVQQVVKGMNEFLAASNTHIKFEFHDELQEYYVTIVDNKSEEIVKEIPAKKVLDMYAAMTEFVGLMVDKKI
ncbi:flagellar protein FlaG [Bacillus sp. SG-1]|uniref:flagellar protein FlaG n=1 Tax=Bacillus sp. SG-1 TaxID=161544 RepID=UPI0001544D1D|nr:flagellar protein FlaG [Bacillus sp. SG-1]EDL63926.1 flagellar protein FlaG [Bacillus sp. SG-1]